MYEFGMILGSRRRSIANVQGSCIAEFDNLTVSELMSEDDSSYNTDMVKRLFLEEEANLILSISFSIRNRKDQCIWGHSSVGQFTMKFAYKCQIDSWESENSRTMQVWKHIWRTYVMPEL